MTGPTPPLRGYDGQPSLRLKPRRACQPKLGDAERRLVDGAGLSLSTQICTTYSFYLIRTTVEVSFSCKIFFPLTVSTDGPSFASRTEGSSATRVQPEWVNGARLRVTPLDACGWMANMRVRITRNPSDVVNGIRLDRFRKGEVYEVGPLLGSYLLASRYAEPVNDDIPATLVPSSERVLTLREYLDATPRNLQREATKRRLARLARQIRSMKRVTFIVAVNRLDLVPALRREFGRRKVEIVVDRRQGERRRGRQPIVAHERRHRDRRVHDVRAELQSVGFAVNVIS